jgi:uncharacterized membrane protein (DUF2068 family)
MLPKSLIRKNTYSLVKPLELSMAVLSLIDAVGLWRIHAAYSWVKNKVSGFVVSKRVSYLQLLFFPYAL